MGITRIIKAGSDIIQEAKAAVNAAKQQPAAITAPP